MNSAFLVYYKIVIFNGITVGCIDYAGTLTHNAQIAPVRASATVDARTLAIL